MAARGCGTAGVVVRRERGAGMAEQSYCSGGGVRVAELRASGGGAVAQEWGRTAAQRRFRFGEDEGARKADEWGPRGI